MAKPKYYLTTPVYDAAVSPHPEFLYTVILCDAIARHRRMCGFEVAHFLAADTHGVMVEGSSERSSNERTPLVQRNYTKFEELARLVDSHVTHFGGTSLAAPHHAPLAPSDLQSPV